MAVFVILALALLAAALGMVAVAAVVLLRHAKMLTSALNDASTRVSNLATELQEEAAVTSIEAGALQQRLADLRGPASKRPTTRPYRIDPRTAG